jgi:LacI family transcriptional regulator
MTNTGTGATYGLMTDVVLTTPYSHDIVRGIQDGFAARGQNLLITSTGDNPNREARLWQLFRDHGVAGVIFASMHHRAHILNEAPIGKHIVLVNCFSVGMRAPAILPDDANGGYIQAKHLLNLGHRRIGVISLVGDLPATRLRDLGIRRAFLEMGVALDESLVVPGFEGSAREETLVALEAARGMLSRSDRPSAIICGNDQVAMQVYAAAASLRLSIPDDLSVIGFDDFRLIAQTLTPQLTTVALPYYEMGRKAVDMINDATTPQQKTILPCNLVDRRSCKTVSAA